MAFKAIYDAKDMRSTGGGDVNYADGLRAEGFDARREGPRRGRHHLRAGAQLRIQRRQRRPGRRAKVEHPTLGTGGSRETWGGTTCNPYDTARVTGGSSGGSGASVAANLVVCSICETTGGSCRSPGTHNGVVTFVPTKGMISFGGGIGADPYQDRPGISCRTVEGRGHGARSVPRPKTGFFDARDPYTALPRSFASKTPYVGALERPQTRRSRSRACASAWCASSWSKVDPERRGDHRRRSNSELKVLQVARRGAGRDRPTRGYPDDPAIPNMAFTFKHAIAEIVPFHMPEVLSWQKDGKPEFAVPGWDVTSREYSWRPSAHKAPWPANLDFRRIFGNPPGARGRRERLHLQLPVRASTCSSAATSACTTGRR